MAIVAVTVYIDQLEEDACPEDVRVVVEKVVQEAYPYHDVNAELMD